MISESEKNEPKNENSMSMTKIKRDQFLVDIRKHKTQTAINEKRLKLAQGTSTLSYNPLFQPILLPKEQQLPEKALDENQAELQKINDVNIITIEAFFLHFLDRIPTKDKA